MKLLTISLLALICWNLNAQTFPLVQWQQSFGGTDSDYFHGMEQTQDGGIVLTGYSRSPVSGNKTSALFGSFDGWVTKVSKSGSVEWQQSFGGTADDRFYSVEQTIAGGFLLGGTAYSGISGNKTNDAYGNGDFWVVKLSESGNLQWSTVFGGTNSDSLKDIQQTADGGYILGGDTLSPVSGNKTTPGYGSFDFWVVKIDANGVKQWDRSFGGTESDQLKTVRQTSAGEYILGGYSYSGVSGNKTTAHFGVQDFWVLKLDANGNVVWQRTFGGMQSDTLFVVRETNDGGFLLGGDSASAISGNKTNTGFGSLDFWLIKIDVDGNKEWEKVFGGSSIDSLQSMEKTEDGGYILGVYSSSGVSGNKGTVGYGQADYWVVKLDHNYQKQWEKCLGGSDRDQLTSVQPIAGGGFTIAGFSYSTPSGTKTSPFHGGVDAWIVQLAPQLKMNSSTLVSGTFQTEIIGAGGTNYILQASTNFAQWTSVQTNSSPTGVVTLSDTNTGMPERFYRIQQKP